jgi:ABC-type polysaccharide/polyol phosphate export permease
MGRKRKSFRKIVYWSLNSAKNRISKGNNKYSLGILWYLLQPLSLFFVLVFVMSFVFERNYDNYPLYLIIGLIMFNFFRGSTIKCMNAVNSIAKKKNPLVSVTSIFFEAIFAHFFELIILVVLLIFYGNSPLGIIFYPSIFLFFGIFVYGISLMLFVVRTFSEDMSKLWIIFLRALWFVTPNFYFIEKSSPLYEINLFNPLFYFIYIVRTVILDNTLPELWMVITIISVSIFSFVMGIYTFNKYGYNYTKTKFNKELFFNF